MLFNSYEFIFLLLPIALLGNQLFERKYAFRITWLLGCSFFFYAWWNPIYVPLFLATIAFNYLIGSKLRDNPNKWLLALGIITNLLLLGYYKYAEFMVENISWLVGYTARIDSIVLPLAISFFTFQQIAYLADCHNGTASKYSVGEYALFVSFFPQLIAGPIVHHGEMMPQIQATNRTSWSHLSIGVTIFALGLFKKAVLADGIAPYANALFNDPNAGESVTIVHAWMGVVAYGFQIYFDFSGYSDMAIGSARMFGIHLPLNFFAPYRAETISDFWRRWHMTLSRFLRDYLYFPLGGNRNGTVRRYRNLMIVMLLGGLWHGAAWTFVCWGMLHGIYLVVQHAWSACTVSAARFKSSSVYRLVACGLTFAVVHFAWVYFRATSMENANSIVQAMLGFNGISLPGSLIGRLGTAANWLEQLGVAGDAKSGSQFVAAATWIVFLAFIVWFFPTTQQFMLKFHPAWEYLSKAQISQLPQAGFGVILPLHWRPNILSCVLMSIIAVAGILSLPEISEFLYFQF